MREEQRWLLAFALSMAILLGYQWLVGRTAPPTAPEEPQVQETIDAQDAPTAPAAAPVDTAPAAAPAAAPEPTPAAPTAAVDTAAVAPRAASSLTLDDGNAIVTFHGNAVTSWQLVGYRTAPAADAPWVDLCTDKPAPCVEVGLLGAGMPSSVVPLPDSRTGARLIWASGGGRVIAEVRLQSDNRLAATFLAEGAAQQQTFQPYVELASDMQADPSAYIVTGLRFRRAGEVETIQFDDLEASHTWEGRFDWAMWDLKYFGRSIFPPAEDVRIEVQADKPEDAERGVGRMRVILKPQRLSTASVDNVELQVFGGPKEIALLRRVGSGLQESIDFGWTAFLGRPLLSLLHVFEGALGNYGWAIILLTLVIKIVLYPLTRKSYHSMQAMSKLKPKMEELQKKFKGDSQRLNQEMMQLYRTEKVNPLGGCLPMLLQIPIFFALYTVLMVSIELRHAPFWLWVNDLSAPDTLATLALGGMAVPIRILPLIMGVTMFLQQKLTPTTVDPAQQRIFQLMPILFTFLFYGFPSGLVLYWLTNNVVTIGQQWWIQRQLNKA